MTCVRNTSPTRFLLCLCLLALVLPLRAQGLDAQLPVWRALEFERSAFLATAYSFVEVQEDDCNPKRWKLSANNAIFNALMRNDELKVLTLIPGDARLVQRERFSGGSDRRFKFWDYLPQHIVRERRDPGGLETESPEDWPLSGHSLINYPQMPSTVVVTDAYALLVLATRFHNSDDQRLDVVVHTDFNFYRVRMTHGNRGQLEVDYAVEGQRPVRGKRKIRTVMLQVEPLGQLAEETDFSLMGLQGPLEMDFDVEQGIPVKIRGEAPRLGQSYIDLKRVVLRDKPR